MGPVVVNAKVFKVQLLLGYLLLPCLSISMYPRTPRASHASQSQLRGGGGETSTSEDSHVGGLDAHPRGDAPPMLYRVFSRRSVGRYVLATSSLVGECARVYTPAPLSTVSSSLYSRLCIGLDSRRRDARGSLGKRKSPGLSYDKFMSPDTQTGDEEDDLRGDGDGDPTNTRIPKDKYGRVSSSFLVRHEIGGDLGRAGIDPAAQAQEAMEVGVALHPPVLGGEASPKPTHGVDRRRQPRRSTAGSVFNSLGDLGRERRRKPVLDDKDLLSDSDDGDRWDEGAEGGIFSNDKGKLESNPVEADVVRVTPKTTAGRNLVGVDDTATTLVNKLRLGTNSEARSRSRRKTSREMKLNRGR